MKKRPDCIINIHESPREPSGRYPGSDELLSAGIPLGRLTGLKRIGIHHERLPAGRRTSFPHAESTEEEFVYVLTGHPSLWLDGELHPLKPGDGVGFPAGTGKSHSILNETRTTVELLVVGERRPHDNQVFYPKHPERKAQVGEAWWETPPPQTLGKHSGEPKIEKLK